MSEIRLVASIAHVVCVALAATLYDSSSSPGVNNMLLGVGLFGVLAGIIGSIVTILLSLRRSKQ